MTSVSEMAHRWRMPGRTARRRDTYRLAGRPRSNQGATVVIAILLLSLLGAACSDANPTVTNPPTDVPTTTVTTTDAVSTTTTMGNTSTEPAPDLDGWIGSADAGALGLTLRKVVLDHTGCDTDEHLVALEDLARAVPLEIRDPLLAAIVSLRRSADLCNADTFGWQQAVEDALGQLQEVTAILKTGSGNTALPATTGPTAGTPPSADSLIATAQRAISTFGALYDQLLGEGNTIGPNDHWITAGHRGRNGDMANAFEDGGFDIVFVGSSLVVNGFDPIRLADADGRRVFNAGLPRITAEELILWLDTVVRLAMPDLVVYGTETRDVRILGTGEGFCGDEIDDWVWSEDLHDNAFASVDAYDGLQWEHLMFGDPFRFVASENYRAGTNDLGGKVAWTTSTLAEIEISLERSGWEGAYPLCAPRIDAMAANVAKLKDLGIDVIVVLMPVSDYRVTQFERGREEVDAIHALMESAALAAGADAVLDYGGLLTNDQFRDAIHAGENGRMAITDALSADIVRLGL